MSPEKRERPRSGIREASKVQAAARTKSSLPREPLVDRILAAVVITGNETRRRRVYLGLDSAEEAVRRARNAGICATVVLCELRIVGGAE